MIPLRLTDHEYRNFQVSEIGELVRLYKTDVELYEYFDWPRYAWLHGSATTPPRDCRLAGELYYRSHGVTKSPGMPGKAVKHAATAATDVYPHGEPASPVDSSPNESPSKM